MGSERLKAGFLVFNEFTELDTIGPHEVLARCPLDCVLVAESREPVRSERGLRVLPDETFESCPSLDVLVVGGGPGQTAAMENEWLINFIASQAKRARYVAGVCTGTLLLAKAGVAVGKRATTHWLAREELGRLGAIAMPERVVWDGTLVTGAGVSSGIDMALSLAERIFGRGQAERVQLAIEYDPKPPVNAGSPTKAPPGLVQELRRSSRFYRPAQG